MTSGASCPDALVEGVIEKIVSYFPSRKTIEELSKEFREK
jgi:4-hydroxy-3-methylbut-2-enyl diphosphate reductase